MWRSLQKRTTARQDQTYLVLRALHRPSPGRLKAQAKVQGRSEIVPPALIAPLAMSTLLWTKLRMSGLLESLFLPKTL